MSDVLNNLMILHILDHSLPLHSGYTFRSQNIVRTQQERGWNPIVVTSPKQEANSGGDATADEIDNVQYHRSGYIETCAPVLYEVRMMRALYRRIVELIELEKPAILHAHSPILNAIPAICAARKFDIPVVYEIRAFWEDAAANHGTYSSQSVKYKLVAWLEYQVCRRVSTVVAICDGIKNDLIQRGIPENKISRVPNAVDPEKFNGHAPATALADKWGIADKKILGFIGSFYRYEGLDLLVEAFAKIADSRSDIVLLLVGGGMMENSLRKQVEKLNLERRVVFTGRVSHNEIPGVYKLVDLLVYPRQSMRLTNLVTPLKPLEAMAMGMTCIASDVGGHKELIEDGQTGVLFPAGNADALAQLILQLIDDERRRNDIGNRGRAWVTAERTWRKTTARYIDLYLRVLGHTSTET